MVIAVVGSRGFNDYELLEKILSEEVSITKIVSGGSRGADSLAARYARRHNISLDEFKPDWSNLDHEDAVIRTHANGVRYDSRAGLRRNSDIIEASDKVIAFWDGDSSGTMDSLKKAKKLNKKIKIVKYLLL